MHQTLEELCNALDNLSDKIIAAWAEDRTVNEVHGWHHPALTKYDLASPALSIHCMQTIPFDACRRPKQIASNI